MTIYLFFLTLQLLHRQVLAQACISQLNCRTGQFCFQDTNQCRPCWECCTFPQIFNSNCVDNCKCNDGRYCHSSAECGKGMYCSRLSSTCKQCQFCISPEHSSTCQNAGCYYKSLDNTSIVNLNRITLYHYYNTTKALQTIPYISFEQINLKSPLFGNCPRYNTTIVGCPCSQKTPCPSGSYCASIDNLLPINTFQITQYPQLILFNRICQPCTNGSYCPQGSMHQQRCPDGYYCPLPSQKLSCESSNFCTNSTKYSCNYTTLVQTTLYFPEKPEYAFTKALKSHVTGNYCPNNSRELTKCPAKYYCPSLDTQLPCPKGYYCPDYSTQPVKCKPLSICTASSASGSFSYIAVIYVVSTVFVILLLKCILSHNFRKSSKIESSDDYPIPYAPFVEKLTYLKASNISAPWLKELTITFQPCQFNVIIGASGSGKSTCLDLIRGNIPKGKITGNLHFITESTDTKICLSQLEGLRYWKELQQYRYRMGYVPQDDIVYPELTVYENILYSLLLKTPWQYSSSNKYTAIYDTLSILSLENIKDEVVGNAERRGISGGQRKRVNIGLELVAFPSLLIMDEPTSGLDASASQKLIEVCKKLTNINTTIIATLHQPRYTSFIMFDELILLTKFGKVFQGPSCLALMYFNQGLDIYLDPNENPADEVMDIISGSKYAAQELVDIWKQKGEKWVFAAQKTYPDLNDVIQCSFVTSKQSQELLGQELSQQNIIDVFKKYNIPVLRATYVNLTTSFIMRLFKEYTSRTYVEQKYQTVVDRISLFKQLPHSLNQPATNQTRCLVIAYTFAKKLMKTLSIKCSKKSHMNETKFDDILLLSMSINNKLLNPKGTVSVSLTTPRDSPQNNIKIWFYRIAIITLRKLVSIQHSSWPIQLIVPLTAACIVGIIQGSSPKLSTFAGNISTANVVVAVLSAITHIRTFALDKVNINREVASKLTVTQFYIAYMFVDLLWILAIPLMFSVPYYFLTIPHLPFYTLLLTQFMVCWWTSSMSYLIAAFPITYQWLNLICVFVVTIFGVFFSGLNPTISEMQENILLDISYNRWATEILTLNEYKFYEPYQTNFVWLSLDKIGFCNLKGTYQNPSVENILEMMHKFESNIEQTCMIYRGYLWLLLYGCIFRFAAFCILYYNTKIHFQRFQWRLFYEITSFIFRIKYILSTWLQKLSSFPIIVTQVINNGIRFFNE